MGRRPPAGDWFICTVNNPLLTGLFPPTWVSDKDDTTPDGNVTCTALTPPLLGPIVRTGRRLARELGKLP